MKGLIRGGCHGEDATDDASGARRICSARRFRISVGARDGDSEEERSARGRLRAWARRRALSRGDGRRTCGTFERRGTTFRTRIARVGSDRGRVGSCKTKDGVVRRRLEASSFFFALSV
jgi:hypothetical protein